MLSFSHRCIGSKPSVRWGVGSLLVLGFALLGLALAELPSAAAQETVEEAEREETPGPGSEESPAFSALPPPLLRPPPGLEFVPDSPASRASLHLHRAASIWPLVEHLAAAASVRFLTGPRGPVRPEPSGCAEAEAIRRLLDVAQLEFEAELKTGVALLESVPSEAAAVEILRVLASELDGRLNELGPSVRYLRRQTKRWACGEHEFSGLEGLQLAAPPEALAGRALLVEATRPSVVLWLDGIPVAVTGPQSWGLVLLQRSGQVLCESDPRAPSCRGGRTLGEPTSAYLRLGAD